MNKTEDIKRKQVYYILLKPIECTTNDTKTIFLYNNMIYSSQAYHTKNGKCYDPDMSDFAIGFYKILYKDILNSHCILTKEGTLMNDEFAGDTMNSFNIIANHTPGAGKSKKSRTPKEKWPEYLRIYKKQYHCLANFWILPREIGRTQYGILNKLKEANDYMDKFLKKVETTIDFTNDREYYEKFKNWKLFVKKHYLINSYVSKTLEVEIYSENDSESFIEKAIEKMELRAKLIAESEIALELWEYFNAYDLVIK